MHLINALRPTHFVMIAAEAQEIVNRRNSDKTRQRDSLSVKEIETELEISRIVVSCLLCYKRFTIYDNYK